LELAAMGTSGRSIRWPLRQAGSLESSSILNLSRPREGTPFERPGLDDSVWR
jgi:hypothetical protein